MYALFCTCKVVILKCYISVQTRRLGLDIRLGTANELLQLEEVGGELDVVLEVVLCVHLVCLLVGIVLLNVQTDGGAAGSGTRQTDNDSAAVVELDVDTLVLADAAIKIGVAEVVGLEDLAARDGGSDELVLLGGDELLHVSGHLLSTLGLTALVVVTSEESATVDLPEVLLDRLDAGGLALLLTNTSNDVEPCDNGPKTILLTDVVGTSTERLLTTDVHLVGIEQTTEELPASGDLV